MKEVEKWFAGLQEHVNKDYKAWADKFLGSGWEETNKPPVLTLTVGKRYYKVVSDGSCAFCFVDPCSGDIFKPAGWGAPAKHARGNILDQDPYAKILWTGTKSLRG